MNGWSQIQMATADMHAAFVADMADPLRAQERQLREILLCNRESEIGARYRFSNMHSMDEYCSSVPVSTYEDVASSIGAMASGKARVLTSSDVVIYEETAGSSGAAKLIPYTRQSLSAFRRALYPWIASLLRERPAVMKGRSYWALSPVTRARRITADGTPVGMTSDSDYLEPSLAREFGQLSVTPAELGAVQDLDDWRYLTLRCLVAARDLTFISVWSPTFLFPLLGALVQNGQRLVADIERGSVDVNLPLGMEDLADTFRPDPARAAELAAAISGAGLEATHLWPALDAISCWTSGSARQFIGKLHASFPGVWMQGKGLMATEGIVTIPLMSFDYPVLAINSGFFEFLDSAGRCRLCHELSVEESYRVLMTTHGGLYRYELGDRVRMRGWAKATPMLEFTGRAGVVSDLCGEKLSEDFVQGILPDDLGFTMLAPSLDGGAHYVLFLDAMQCDLQRADILSQEVDKALQANPQYHYARKLGQLGEVAACRVVNPMDRFTDAAVAGGQRLAVVKPPALRRETYWETRFSA